MENQQEHIQDSKTKTTEQGLKDLIPAGKIQKVCDIHGLQDFDVINKILFGSERQLQSCPRCRADRDREGAQLEREKKATEQAARQAAINKRLENAMLAPRFATKTFENYKVDTDGQKEAFQATQWFLKNFNTSMGLIFIGKPGTGKNHLAAAIVKEVVNEGKTALMTEAIKIVRAIKESWRKDGQAESDVLKNFVRPDLLVVDEMGVQFGSDTEKMYLTEIINDRYNAIRPTILMGNVTLPNLEQIVGERAIERFKEGGKVVVFDWQSYRGVKK